MTKARDLADFAGKADTIETSATADQTDAEIRAAVEAATDSNVFTDADHTKLNAIEAAADVTDTANVVAALTAGANITIAANGTVAGAASFTLPTASGSTLGGVKIGSGLSINGSGVVTASGATNLASTTTATAVTVTSSTGDNAALAAATASAAGVMLASDKSKLDGIASSATDNTVASAALPKSGGALTGAVTTNSTFDGVDIATRDAVLTSTTTTAGAALPKSGGALTGAVTTNSTFDGRDVAADGVLATNALPKAGGTITGQVNSVFAGGGDFVHKFQNTTAGTPYGVMIKDASGGSTGYPLLNIANDAGNITHFRVDSGAGRVLVGTTAAGYPAYADNLTVAASGNGGITIRTGNTSQGNIYFSDETGTGGGTFSGIVSYEHSSNSMNFYTATSNRLRIDADGIKFHGDTAAANGLNDYETGNATLTWSGTGGSANTSSTTWNYVKIGNLVTVSGNTSSALPNATGTMILTGLPFTANRNATGSILYRYLTAPSGMHTMIAYITGGTTQILPFWSGSAGYGQLQSSHFATNGAQDMYMTVSYTTDS